MKRLLADWIEVRVWSFEVGPIKPEREIFAAAFQKLGCAPHEVLMVGDSLVADYQGAVNAGMQAVLLDRHYRISKVRTISDLRAIHRLVAQDDPKHN